MKLTLADVFSDVEIDTGLDEGIVGVSKRDNGIEVRVGGETVWKSKEPNGVRLPDGSGVLLASFPLPKDHWIYTEGHNEPPMPMRIGLGAKRNELADQIRAATRYAVRASTMNGTEMDFDPDAMVQNMVVGLLGYWTEDGRHKRHGR